MHVKCDRHRPLVSIQLCLVLPPPSSSSYTCILWVLTHGNNLVKFTVIVLLGNVHFTVHYCTFMSYFMPTQVVLEVMKRRRLLRRSSMRVNYLRSRPCTTCWRTMYVISTFTRFLLILSSWYVDWNYNSLTDATTVKLQSVSFLLCKSINVQHR